MHIPANLRASLTSPPEDLAGFVALWRGQAELLGALPARYGQALENILQRLESGAAFQEESCSFSQGELIEALKVWLDRATTALPGKG